MPPAHEDVACRIGTETRPALKGRALAVVGQQVGRVLEGALIASRRAWSVRSTSWGSLGSGSTRPLIALTCSTTLTRSATTEAVVRATVAASVAGSARVRATKGITSAIPAFCGPGAWRATIQKGLSTGCN